MPRTYTEQQLALPVILVEEVQPDMYLIPDFWAAAQRLRSARRRREQEVVLSTGVSDTRTLPRKSGVMFVTSD